MAGSLVAMIGSAATVLLAVSWLWNTIRTMGAV